MKECWLFITLNDDIPQPSLAKTLSMVPVEEEADCCPRCNSSLKASYDKVSSSQEVVVHVLVPRTGITGSEQ